jgi:conjugal transfer pilus assembly protein TraL
MKYVKVPRFVDENMQISFFEIDEVMFIVAGLFLGVLFKMLFWGLIAGFFLASLFSKYKQSKNRGFLLHFIYWHGFVICKRSFVDMADKRFWIK